MRVFSPRPGSRRATERRTRHTLAAFLLVALLAAAPAAAGWWDDAGDARETSLAELRRAPERWRDVPVLLRVRFGGTGERVNPYFTQFTPERWQPIKLLPLNGAVGSERELGTAFVVRGGREDLRLARISPNRPVLARAVVRDAVAGEPWVEILAFTLDGDPLTPEEGTRVGEADRFLDKRNPKAAERLYREVLAGRKLASRDQAGLLRKIGVALHDQRRPHDALAAFRKALEIDPDDQDAQHRATHLEESLARTPLPTTEGGTPPIAGRAAASTPTPPARPDEPLLLPGSHRALAPPSGLPAGPRDDDPTPAGSTEKPRTPAPPRPATSKPATSKPVTSKPVPSDPAPTTREGDDDATDETPPEPPVQKQPEPAQDEDEDEDAPPPVPKPPRLSGPK